MEIFFFVASHVCSEWTGKREKGNINISITMSLSKSTGNKWKNPLQHRRPSWPPVPGLFLKTCSRSFVGRGQSDRTDISRGANSCTRSCVDSYLGYHLQAAQNNRKNENNMEIVENSSPFFALVLFLPWLIEHNLQEGQAAATSGIWRIFFISEAIRRTTFSHPTETPNHPGWPWYISENTGIDMFSFTILSIPLICSS